MAELVCWSVRLKIRGPLLTTSSAPIGFGVDAPFSRNEAGDYYIAGTLVKGRLKEAWQELGESEGSGWDWERWVGKEPKEAEDWDSERGLLQFTDFVFQQVGSARLDEDQIIYRIKRDPQTKSVLSGQNLMIQSPFLAGAEYWFEGRIWAIVAEAEAGQLSNCLRQGLCYVAALGSEVSVGFGVLTDVEVGRATDWRQGSGWDQALNEDQWGIAIEPEGPLCLAGRRLADNIFESESEISGGVIKGALANMILRLHASSARDVSALAQSANVRWKELCEEFSKIRVLHGKPVQKGSRQRPVPIPASAVKVGKQSILRDTALKGNLQFVDGAAPTFQIDWKRYEDAQKYFGIRPVRRELRVRTQIETVARRAKDGNLFAYRMLVPRAKNAQEQIEEFEWLAHICFEGVAVEKRQIVKSQLTEILRQYGLGGVGKLKTRCVVSCARVEPVLKSGLKTEPNLWVITLQTPALLCDIEGVEPGLSDASKAYSSYWKDASFGSLDLERWFATQNLVGGRYVWRQFARGQAYRPFVLTHSGSTFVLRVVGDREKAQQSVDRWSKNGLPIARTVRDRFSLAGNPSDWQRCPYVPENGFGEIAVDLEWHWKESSQ